MAITATIAVNNSSVSTGQSALFTVTITNPDGTDVSVTSITPVVSPVGSSIGQGTIFFAPQNSTVVPAGGTLNVSFSDVFYAAQAPSSATTQQFPVAVSATVTASGTSSATTNSVNMQITPATTPTTSMPTLGQLRFDTNVNSAHLAAA